MKLKDIMATMIILLLVLTPIAFAAETAPETAPETEPAEYQESSDKLEYVDGDTVDTDQMESSSISEGDTEEKKMLSSSSDPVTMPYLQETTESIFDFSKKNIYYTSLYSGSFNYFYSIDVPLGTNGLTPSVSLVYNSQTEGRPDSLGASWQLANSYIQRNSNYSVEDTDDDYYQLNFDGSTYDLIYDSDDGLYHTKIESFLKIEQTTGGDNDNDDYWIVSSTDGTSYRFGYNTESEAMATEHDEVWKWSLDLIEDMHENKIYYNYEEDPYSEDDSEPYLTSIEYNNDQSRVIEFDYSSSAHDTPWFVYELGATVSHNHLLEDITVTADSSQVYRYELDYDYLDDDFHFAKPFLQSVTVFGSDDTNSLEPTSFTYYEPENYGWEESDWDIPVDFVSSGGTDYGVRLADINRDGLVDMVYANDDENVKEIYLNDLDGEEWDEEADDWDLPEYFVDNDNSDTGLRFMEVDGDGYLDLVYADYDEGDMDSYSNDFYDWDSESDWDFPVYIVDTDGQDYGVRIIDLNADGLDDILMSSDHAFIRAYINTGADWDRVDSYYDPPIYHITRESGVEVDNGVRYFDVNGDSLPDMIRDRGGETEYTYINNGVEWVRETDNWESQKTFVDSDGLDYGVRIADVNGDGLQDLIRSREDNTEYIYFNDGLGWNRNSDWDLPEPFVDDDKEEDYGTRLADVNGDGMVDFLRSQAGSGGEAVYTNTMAKIGLLTTVTTSEGASIEIEYASSYDYDNTGSDSYIDLPFSIWLVSSVSHDNGMAGDHVVTLNVDYTYENGMYNFEEREFRGFDYVEEYLEDQDSNFKTIEHYFYQDDAKQGKEYQSDISRYSSTYSYTKDWNYDEDDDGYFIVYLESEAEYESSSYQKVINYEYDDYGNPTLIEREGFSGSTGDEIFEVYDYVYNEDDWIVNTVKTYSVYDFDSDLIYEEYYTYDDQSYGDEATLGDITSSELWLDDGNIEMSYSYDSYGNMESETDFRGYTTEYSYDSTYTYLNSVTDALGYITEYDYDLGTGNLNSETDDNGYETSFEYDEFGRFTKLIKPYDSSSSPTIEYEYQFDGTAPEYIIESSKIDSSTEVEKNSYYDGFGNLIQDKNEIEGSEQIVVDYYYTGFGKLDAESHPYTVSSSSSYYTSSSFEGTTLDYDLIDRVTDIQYLDGTDKDFHYGSFWELHYDRGDNVIGYEMDGQGNIVEVKEVIDGGYYYTAYEYDGMGNIIEIEDEEGNIFTFEYDQRGLQTYIDDPNRGEWTFEYDENGNLLSSTDARGETIEIEYDELNRIELETSDDGDVEYTYDQDYSNTLSSVEQDDYSVDYDYDQKYRIIEVVTTIDGEEYSNEFEYDSMDRVSSKTLPDASSIDYEYNFQGFMISISDVIDEVDYNEFGKPVERIFSNGLVNEFDYDEDNFRLETIYLDGLQDYSYTLDGQGNILEIDDAVNELVTSYSYDNLYRLEEANQVDYAGDEIYTVEYEYDAIGNILSLVYDKYNIDFSYDVSTPIHSPSSYEKESYLDEYLLLDVSFDDGTFEDESDYAHVGSLNGVDVIEGVIENAIEFDGGDFVQVDNAETLNPSEEMTVSFWISPDDLSTSTAEWLVKRGYSYEDSSQTWGFSVFKKKVYFFINTDEGKVTVNSEKIDEGRWTYVTGVYDGSSIDIYINGELEDTNLQSGDLYRSSKDLIIGCNSASCSSSGFKGRFDELQIYSTVINEEDILTFYEDQVGDKILDMSFDDGTFNDNSIFENHGTNFGADSVTGVVGDAMEFDGSDYVEINSHESLNLEDVIQIDFSFSVEDLTSYPGQWILKRGYNYESNSQTWGAYIWNGVLYFKVITDEGSSFVESNELTESTWVDVELKYDGNSIEMYIDDVLIDSTTHSGNILDSSNKMIIGCNSASCTKPFVGKLDELVIYGGVS